MSVSVYNATEDQIKKITKKHCEKVYHGTYSHDSEDNMGIIWCSSNILGSNHFMCCNMGLPILQWQVRGSSPMFFSLQKGGKRYDINYPNGDLEKRLIEIQTKIIDKFNKGSEI